MTFLEIMSALSKMYSSYDATCWLSKPRRALDGETAAELIKQGKEKRVGDLLKKEAKYKKLKSKAE